MIIVDDPNSWVKFDIVWDAVVTDGGYGSSILGNGVLDDVEIEPFADYISLDLGYIGGDLSVDNAWWLSATVDHVLDEVDIDDVSHADFQIGTADEVWIDDSSDIDLHVTGEIDGDLYVGDSVDVRMWTSDEDDSIILDDVFKFSVDTNGGYDDVSVNDSSGIVLSGFGGDHLSFNNSEIAYNPGGGNDHVFISGGRTLGNLSDGESDTLVFDLMGGGQHTAVVDPFDEVYISAGAAGLWDFAEAEAIGLTHTSWMQASLLVNDWGGKG